MIFRFCILIFILLQFTSCVHFGKRPDNKEFANLTTTFLKELWETHPTWASSVGLSEYDSILEIPDKNTRDKKLDFYKRYLNLFKNVDETLLSISQSVDHRLIINELEKGIWTIEVFKSHEWNPAMYNIGPSISAVLEKKKNSLDERLKNLNEKLLKVPEFYKAAKVNINKPTREHLKLAIKQAKGLEKYLKSLADKKFEDSGLSRREKQSLNQRIKAARTIVKNHIRFLNKILRRPKKVGGFRSFSIGRTLYNQKFKFYLQVTNSPEQLYKKALDAKEDVLSKMFELATALYPKYYGTKLPPKDRHKVISSVIKKISKKHGKPKEFIESIKKQLSELTEFVKRKDLLTLDPNKPLEVRETPLYQRGFAGASIDAPEPFDKNRQTYYNVTPLDNMSPKQQKSYLREYNDYTLQILNIHEAIPGHYVQLIYGNQSSSLIQSILATGTMTEGWAVYAERMMLEQGYGDNSRELWLMYYKWFLRVVTNTIIDYEIHNKNLSKKQALKLMINEAFQEKTEAEKKWKRATFSQVQLAYYFAGFTEIYELREQIKTLQGKRFNLKKFHETFLSFGNIPVREIKKLMTQK